jgi:putative salt-induced outer membrane protein YdiY
MRLSTISALVALGLFASASQAEEEQGFTMDGEFGFIVTSGNTETTSANGALNAKHELEMWSNEYTLKALYKKDEVDGVETTSADKKFASAQANYKLDNPDHRLFGFASYENDRFGAFDYQATIAAGWNQKVWMKMTISLLLKKTVQFFVVHLTTLTRFQKQLSLRKPFRLKLALTTQNLVLKAQ